MVQGSNGKYFACDECPICEDIERRILFAGKYSLEPQLEYCYCDKVGAKFYVGGQCSDAEISSEEEPRNGARKTGRAYRRRMNYLKKKRLMEIVKSGYNYSFYTNWEYTDGSFHRLYDYIRYPQNSNRKRFLKKYSNRKVRRAQGESMKGNQYRKVFDYWWELD